MKSVICFTKFMQLYSQTQKLDNSIGTFQIGNLSQLKACLIIAILATILTIPWLGLKDFATRGEPREAIVAQAMLRSGDWILGVGYGDKVPSKPPLAHWTMLIFSLPAGEVSVFSARLGSALAFVVFAIFFQQFLQKRIGVAQALLTNFTLLGSIEWLRAATTCRVDMLLSVLIALGLLSLYSWYERKFQGIPIASIFLLALATLAKGPVGVVLPALVFAIFLLLKRERLSSVISKCTLVFIPALLLGSLWFIYAFLSDERFVEKFVYENIKRFLSTTEDHPHEHGLFYLLGTLVVGLMPWVMLSGAELVRGFRRLFNKQNDFELFALLSIIVYIIFFSIPSGKRSVYLLPAYPFIAYFLAKLTINKRAVRLYAAFAAVIMLTLILICILPEQLLAGPADRLEILPYLQALINNEAWYYLILPLLYAVFICIRRNTSLTHDYCLVFIIYLTLHIYLLPIVSNVFTPKAFAERASTLIATKKIYSFQDEFFGISFYLNRRIYVTDGSALQAGDLVFVSTQYLDLLKTKLNAGLEIKSLLSSGHKLVENHSQVELVQVYAQTRKYIHHQK